MPINSEDKYFLWEFYPIIFKPRSHTHNRIYSQVMPIRLYISFSRISSLNLYISE